MLREDLNLLNIMAQPTWHNVVMTGHFTIDTDVITTLTLKQVCPRVVGSVMTDLQNSSPFLRPGNWPV